jgi:dienelactone hydrolase
MRALLLGILLVTTWPLLASPLWGDLKPGPHAVGFKAFPLRDATRTVRPAAGGGDRSQMLMVSVWYPAQRVAGAAPMTFDDYGRHDRYDPVTLALPSEEAMAAARQQAREFFLRPMNFPDGGTITDEAWARLLATPLTAVLNAPAVAGSFPAIAGNNGARINAVTNEYLASHGYIVAAVGTIEHPATTPVEQTEWSARNVEFTIAWLRSFPNADPERLGIQGFSGAGFGPYIAAMRHSDVDAVVAIESGLYMAQFSDGITGHPSYGATKLRVPFLHMFRAAASRADEDLAEFRKLRHAERYRFLLDRERLVHQDFSILGPASVLLGMRGDAGPDAIRAFGAVNVHLLRFYDAFLKNDPAARAALVADTADITVERLAATRPAPDLNEARELFRKEGVDGALQRLAAARKEDPEADLFGDATLAALGWHLINDRNPGDRNLDAAKAVAGLVAAQAPGTVYDHNLAGNIDVAEGRTAEAITRFEKAVAALPNATRMTPAEREQSRVNIQAKIDRLRGRQGG